jgi:DtxR family Mn-dependent transcriptional regulator
MESSATLDELSAKMQMYLKAIHEIQTHKGAARVTDIALALDVRKATVTSALKTLSAAGLLNYEPYNATTLSELGLSAATELDRRYDVLRSFFVRVLGIDGETANTDACGLEHHISETLYDRLIGFIEYYHNCTELKFRWDPDLGGYCRDPNE